MKREDAEGRKAGRDCIQPVGGLWLLIKNKKNGQALLYIYICGLII